MKFFTCNKKPPEMLLGILQNSQENTFARGSFLIKLQAVRQLMRQSFTWMFFIILHEICKKPPEMFLGILQNSQENTFARAWQRCFPVNFVKFLRTPFLTEHLWWLLLILEYISHAVSSCRNNLTKKMKNLVYSKFRERF